MKQIHILVIITILLFTTFKFNAQTIWTGTTITFTKSSNADWTLAANQDRITNNVWITRADTQGIFNIATETTYSTNPPSPSDTQWAFGTTANISSLTFQNWKAAISNSPPNSLNQDMVLHLITDDIYIDIKFIAWSQGASAGGGFSYERSTDQTASVHNFNINTNFNISPNPSLDFIQISGLTKTENYTIYNVLGAKINDGIVSDNNKVDIHNLINGIYFFKLENGNAVKFIKK